MTIQTHRNILIGLLLAVSTVFSALFSTLAAEENTYLCEIGVQGGVGYYVGEANPHIFMHPREAYGVHFRYKFTKNWAIQAKVGGQRIAGYDRPWPDQQKAKKEDMKMWTNQLINFDVMAEFNFFRFGASNEYDKRIKPYTPYIFLGLGVGMYNDVFTDYQRWTISGYVPLGIGFKWKFYDCLGLNIAWQHNIYFADDLEGKQPLNNPYSLNGSNWMNCDLTGQFTLAFVVEFGRVKKKCIICNY